MTSLACTFATSHEIGHHFPRGRHYPAARTGAGANRRPDAYRCFIPGFYDALALARERFEADDHPTLTRSSLSGVGSFDGTREDAVLIMQGGDLGELGRQIVDTIRNIRTLSQLWLAVNGHEPYWRVVLASTATETCTLVDLLYGRDHTPAGVGPQFSLVELLERDVPRSNAISLLRAAAVAVDTPALAHVRDLRNRIGAHVDEQLTVGGITRLMETFNAAALNEVLDHCFATITAAVRLEFLLRPIMMFDTAMRGFALAELPEASRPYRGS